jgi:hypothetical protein
MRMAVMLFALVLLGCSTSPYRGIPQYALPDTREKAARHLNEAVAFGGIGYSEVWADQEALRWQQRRDLTETYTIWVERELLFSAIRGVTRARRAGESFEVKVEATGGAVTFRFKDGPSAAKAESALLRLKQPE